MAKQVTVLALEGDTLRGVRLDSEGEAFERGPTGAWPLVMEESPAADEDATPEGVEGEVAETEATEVVLDEDKPLARAFRAAAAAFGTRDFALSVPLSKLLVKVVRLPAEARDDLLGAAQLELDGISPFPDEALTPGAEIVAETDRDIVAVFAALPDAASAEIGEALAAAKVHVTRTDVTALGWLRGLWPRICERQDVRRRLVLLNLDGGWDVVLIEDGAPVFLRGLGVVASAAELGREVMLSQLQLEDGGNVDEVVLCVRGQVAEDVQTRVGAFGPVRTVLVEDEVAGAEGSARRAVEGAALDVTPEAWREARVEHRFRRRMLMSLAVAGGIWLALMGVLFGVDTAYDFLTDRQKSLQKEPRHKRAFQEVAAMTNRVALIERYADHDHGALMVLKMVSDSLPDSEDMSFRTFQYRRNESVRVNGSAGQREDLRSFTENLEAVSFGDDDDVLFAKVQQSGGETQTKKGIRFAIECFFRSDEEENSGKGKR